MIYRQWLNDDGTEYVAVHSDDDHGREEGQQPVLALCLELGNGDDAPVCLNLLGGDWRPDALPGALDRLAHLRAAIDHAEGVARAMIEQYKVPMPAAEPELVDYRDRMAEAGE